ncbi:unnamed protein product [Candidula unifasciata]|uniref:UDP-glucuronosyltransferase n=1 Tax=Candidula unifasciata TaxID=100452 RepID=A0A8S3ZV48_9EUPU|nr:unnamed protein product [Candidula unifasciata]
MMRYLLQCLLLLGHYGLYESRRIVIVPVPNVSHTSYLTNVARALVDLGHEAWVCMPAYVADQPVFNITGVHVIRYSSNEINTVDSYMKYVRDAYWKDENVDIQRMIDILFEHIEHMITDRDLENAIRAIQPDLMIIDNPPTMRMIAVLAYKLGIPFAFVGSMYDPIGYRVPFTPATLPSALFPYTEVMSFFQRSVSFGVYAIMILFEIFSYTDAVSRFAPEKPYLPIRELTSRAEIVLIESDPILDYPKVSLPNVKLIGGTSVSYAMPLQEPFKSFVDQAELGVVVVAFGSYIVDIPQKVSDKLIAAFKRLPLNVVWRVNMVSPDPDKILTSSWIPQNDLLGHHKVKVLVTHCGQSSQYEALFHGVPMLCMPIFMDQPYNAERTRSKGFGLTLDLKSSTTDEIFSNVMELYTNPQYKTHIRTASKLFKINYKLPKEQAAFWLDHVLQHGGDYMRSLGQTMPGYQFYSLDVLAFCLLIISLLSICCFYVIKTCISRLTVLISFISCAVLTQKHR